MKQSPRKKSKRNRGYAARLQARRSELGLGPLQDSTGKPLPWPRTAVRVQA